MKTNDLMIIRKELEVLTLKVDTLLIEDRQKEVKNSSEVKLTERMMNFKKDDNKQLNNKFYQDKFYNSRREIYELLKNRRDKTEKLIQKKEKEVENIEKLRSELKNLNKYISDIDLYENI